MKNTTQNYSLLARIKVEKIAGMATTNKTLLELLRKRYNEGEMSALVGAGFSKNVSEEDYLSWKELLSDMIKYLYEQR
jgi:hypothetical protein